MEMETDSVENLGIMKSNGQMRPNIHTVSLTFALVFIGCLLVLFGIVYKIDGILPTPLKVQDEVSLQH